MMVVIAGGEKQRPDVRALRHRQSQELTVEALRRCKIGYVEVDMPKVGLGWRFRRRWLVCDGGQEIIEIQRLGHHGNLPILPAPL